MRPYAWYASAISLQIVLSFDHPLGTFRVVIEQLLNQIDVRQHHPPAAIPLQAEFVQRVTANGEFC